jgi:hypothetical protein
MLDKLKTKLDENHKISIHLFYEANKQDGCKLAQFEFVQSEWNQEVKNLTC